MSRLGARTTSFNFDMLFGHWFPPQVSCSAVQEMDAVLLFALKVTINMVLPMCFICKMVLLMFEMYAHLGTYFKVTTILLCAFLYAPSIYYFMFYLLFCVMMMLFYLYICNYVVYRRPQGRIAY